MIKLTGLRVLKREVEVEVSAYDAILQVRKEWMVRTSPGILADYIDENNFWVGVLGETISQYREATPEEIEMDKAFKLILSQFKPTEIT